MTRPAALWAVLALAAAGEVAGQAPIRCPGPLSEAQLLDLVKGRVPEPRVRQYVATCGIGFALTAETERRLRAAGATQAILDLLRSTEPGAAAELQLRAELALWESIKESRDGAVFEDYLRRYPAGQFAAAARSRLGELRVATLREAARKAIEARDWEAAAGAIGRLADLAPGDAEVAAWRKRVAAGREEDRVTAERKARVNDLGMEFVTIPAGTFRMGCSSGDHECKADEFPPHDVRITNPFQMQTTEVTQKHWQAVMGASPGGLRGDPNLPAAEVSWNDVQAFLAVLNGRKDGFRYRLPTEAQWEYAMRAGTTGRFAGDIDDVAWYRANSGNVTHPVGQKKPNAWGLYDMAGNVWEWCADLYDPGYYHNSPAADPPGPPSGERRVLRGGAFYGFPRLLRASVRITDVPGFRGKGSGFRCVREPVTAP
jgi:formylglycine-generating enzyme required for sulfatase activity